MNIESTNIESLQQSNGIASVCDVSGLSILSTIKFTIQEFDYNYSKPKDNYFEFEEMEIDIVSINFFEKTALIVYKGGAKHREINLEGKNIKMYLTKENNEEIHEIQF